ncbi:MAG: extracellular solute-binding protein [Acidiphilium sp.]|nr:extracellular solute-binding protein [Acidiphilium sp.]MDD4935966.1 extracellular solute-binding protein [Acidiphilium sp.]
MKVLKRRLRLFGGLAQPALAAAVGVAALLGGSVQAESVAPLILYSAQHPQVVAMLTKAFEAKTGIAVRVHSGEGPEIANQILREGKNSPADLVFVENAPELTLLDQRHFLAPVAKATLAIVPTQDSAANGDWLGVLERQNVLAWNPNLIGPAALPKSLLDLASPAWKGKVAIAPSDADFLPLVGAMIHAEGKAGALAWLKGLKRNAKIYQDDESVVAAVNRGSVATGIVNNYYWARLRTEMGPAHTPSRIAHFAPGDIGNLLNVSGAAVLASSHHQAEAQRFLAFLVSAQAQRLLAKSTVDYEYPLRPGIAPNKLLDPMATLHPPAIAPAELGNDREAAALLQQAGLI